MQKINSQKQKSFFYLNMKEKSYSYKRKTKNCFSQLATVSNAQNKGHDLATITETESMMVNIKDKPRNAQRKAQNDIIISGIYQVCLL